MYIPLGFNASSQCTGSGYSFTYANFGTTVDDFSYRNLCNPNIIVSASLQPGEVIQFISANQSTVNGIGANTHLVDGRWAVQGGFDNLVYRSYTLTHGGSTSTRAARFSQQNIGDTMPYGSGGKIVTGGEMSPSPFTFTSSFNPDNMISRYGFTTSGYTLVDNGPVVGSAVLRGTGKNSFNRVMYIEMLGDSGSQATYLDAAYKPVLFNIPSANGGQYAIDIVSPTLPQLRETGSAAVYSRLGGYRQKEFTTVSKFVSSGSCYSFTFDYGNSGGPDRTFTYVDCNYVTQSLVVSSSITLGICMKADSLRLPTLSSVQSLTLSGAEVCTGSIPL